MSGSAWRRREEIIPLQPPPPPGVEWGEVWERDGILRIKTEKGERTGKEPALLTHRAARTMGPAAAAAARRCEKSHSEAFCWLKTTRLLYEVTLVAGTVKSLFLQLSAG
ncbi:unnamed protein product [Arctogadus glacialis]